MITDCPDCDRDNGHGGRLTPKVHFHLAIGNYTIQEVAGIAYLYAPSGMYQFSAGLGDTDRALSATPEILSRVVAHLQKFNGRTIFPTTFAQAVFAIEQQSQPPTPMMDWGNNLSKAFAVGIGVAIAIIVATTPAVAQCKQPPTQAEIDAMPTVYQEGMTDEQIEEALQKVMPEFGFCADGKNKDKPICQPNSDGDNG
ncbi:hypothetical protein [Kamptonema sp. UHCC 0994]|uniref:hypothetical protein n=1 Tax=Kamptonema sp. UHCC 0994 TaxID=3031329 RepID=UPI0023B9AFD5|nr:hypothetical protein [Kamptonema sp. UHCC 0994]MDF0552203.1 hypothetical protein [Kamptonema sp. UHCC 0994]